MANELHQATNVAADADFAQSHRFERFQRRHALVDHRPYSRIDQHVHDGIPGRHVTVGNSSSEHDVTEPESARLSLQGLALRTVADDDQAEPGSLGLADPIGIEQRREALEPENGPDESDDKPVRKARRERPRLVPRYRLETRAVYAIRHNLELVRRDPSADQFFADASRNRDDEVGAPHRAKLETPDEAMLPGVGTKPGFDHRGFTPERPHFVDERQAEFSRRRQCRVRIRVGRMRMDNVGALFACDLENGVPVPDHHHRPDGVGSNLGTR